MWTGLSLIAAAAPRAAGSPLCEVSLIDEVDPKEPVTRGSHALCYYGNCKCLFHYQSIKYSLKDWLADIMCPYCSITGYVYVSSRYVPVWKHLAWGHLHSLPCRAALSLQTQGDHHLQQQYTFLNSRYLLILWVHICLFVVVCESVYFLNLLGRFLCKPGMPVALYNKNLMKLKQNIFLFSVSPLGLWRHRHGHLYIPVWQDRRLFQSARAPPGESSCPCTAPVSCDRWPVSPARAYECLHIVCIVLCAFPST